MRHGLFKPARAADRVERLKVRGDVHPEEGVAKGLPGARLPVREALERGDRDAGLQAIYPAEGDAAVRVVDGPLDDLEVARVGQCGQLVVPRQMKAVSVRATRE